MMYMTRQEKAKNLSVKQVELLLLMQTGIQLVHNEGAGFRCWMEKDKKQISYTVRKDTANVVSELKLLQLLPGEGRLYRHHLSQDGEEVLELVEKRKKDRALWSLQRAGLDTYLLETKQGGN